jgi:hypothetical protein
MATCPSCGKEIRDDVWTCGSCGAPVAQPATGHATGGEDSAYGSEGYNPYAAKAAASSAYGAANYGGVEPGGYGTTRTEYDSTPEGMTPYGTPMPQAGSAKSAGLSQSMKLVLVFAGVAVIAIVAIWFFVLRGGGGDQFIGTWTAVKNGEGGLVIERGDDGLQVSLIGADESRVGPLKTHLDGDELEIKLEAVGGGDSDKAAVDMVRALFEATVEDFKMVLRFRGADTRLLMYVSGKSKIGGDQTTTPVTEFTRAGTTTL